MCTPGLRELKRINPDCHVTFFTPYVDLLKGLPYIDEVRHYDPNRPGKFFRWLYERSWRIQFYLHPDLPHGTIRFWVEDSMPPRRHIAELMADHLGVNISDVRPDCAVDRDLLMAYRGNGKHSHALGS